MQEFEYRNKDINHKRIAFFVAVILAVLGWFHNMDIRKKEFQKSYYDQRIKTINMVFDVVHKISAARTEEEKLKASEEFWTIHYGYSMPYLNGKLFTSLNPLSEYINKCIQKHPGKHDGINCSYNIKMYLPKFSIAARKELSKSWDIDFEEISKTHPWHGK